MKKLIIALLLFPSITFAQFTVPQGGTGRTTFTTNQLIYGVGSSRFQSTATTSATCAGLVTCSTFNVLGASPITLTGVASFAFPWLKLSTGEMSTTTTTAFLNGLLATASSTVNLVQTPNLTNNGFVKTGSGTGILSIDTTTYLSAMSFAFPWTKLGTGEMSTSTTLVAANGIISNASSTLSSVTATSTNLNISANHVTFGSNFLSATSTPSLIVASSTLVNGASFNRATTSIPFGVYPERRYVSGASCVASSTGGVIFHIGGRTNWSTVFFCDNNVRTYTIGKTIEPLDIATLTVGKASTTPDVVTFTLFMNKLSD